jgi:hypothetical protein
MLALHDTCECIHTKGVRFRLCDGCRRTANTSSRRKKRKSDKDNKGHLGMDELSITCSQESVQERRESVRVSTEEGKVLPDGTTTYRWEEREVSNEAVARENRTRRLRSAITKLRSNRSDDIRVAVDLLTSDHYKISNHSRASSMVTLVKDRSINLVRPVEDLFEAELTELLMASKQLPCAAPKSMSTPDLDRVMSCIPETQHAAIHSIVRQGRVYLQNIWSIECMRKKVSTGPGLVTHQILSEVVQAFYMGYSIDLCTSFEVVVGAPQGRESWHKTVVELLAVVWNTYRGGSLRAIPLPQQQLRKMGDALLQMCAPAVIPALFKSLLLQSYLTKKSLVAACIHDRDRLLGHRLSGSPLGNPRTLRDAREGGLSLILPDYRLIESIEKDDMIVRVSYLRVALSLHGWIDVCLETALLCSIFTKEQEGLFRAHIQASEVKLYVVFVILYLYTYHLL